MTINSKASSNDVKNMFGCYYNHLYGSSVSATRSTQDMAGNEVDTDEVDLDGNRLWSKSVYTVTVDRAIVSTFTEPALKINDGSGFDPSALSG